MIIIKRFYDPLTLPEEKDFSNKGFCLGSDEEINAWLATLDLTRQPTISQTVITITANREEFPCLLTLVACEVADNRLQLQKNTHKNTKTAPTAK